MKGRVLFWVLLIPFWLDGVTCQDDGEEAQETTTEPYIESTTTEAPNFDLEHLDYQFTSLSSGFVIDVNFTEIEGDTENTKMSMLVNADPDSDFAKTVCAGTAVIIAVVGDDCPPGIESQTLVNGDVIAKIQSTTGIHTGTVNFNIPYFYSHNCLLVASTKPVPTPPPTSASTADTTSDEEVITTDGNTTPTTSFSRKRRQSDLDDKEESGDVDDFYDPEDVDQRADDVAAADIEEADYNDNLIEDDEDLVNFRVGGCKSTNLASRIALFEPVPKKLTRIFLTIAAVFGSGSVSRPTSVVSSGSDVAVFFGNAGSFTFNPLANWPIVVLQGNAVLGTYGVIIIWALILGAVVWGISIFGQYSGFFSAERLGYVENNLIYGPIQRLSDLVHSGIEKISDLNRRNAWNIQEQYKRNYYTNGYSNGYQHRSSDYDYNTAYDDNYKYDHPYYTQ